MLYAIASADWNPGQPLMPADTRAGLTRTRGGAGGPSSGRATLAVALRYDATRGVVVALPPAAGALAGRWSAPAILDESGGVTVLSPIPAALVRVVGNPRIRIHRGHADGPTPWHRGLAGCPATQSGAGGRGATPPG